MDKGGCISSSELRWLSRFRWRPDHRDSDGGASVRAVPSRTWWPTLGWHDRRGLGHAAPSRRRVLRLALVARSVWVRPGFSRWPGVAQALNRSLAANGGLQVVELVTAYQWLQLWCKPPGIHMPSAFPPAAIPLRGTRCWIAHSAAELRNVPRAHLATGEAQAMPIYPSGMPAHGFCHYIFIYIIAH